MPRQSGEDAVCKSGSLRPIAQILRMLADALDPMGGRPLRYRTTGEKTFQLYSVGLDGKDGGGDPKPLRK